MTTVRENPLASKPVGSLLVQFAVPSIVSMLVGALYNIVDQFFIGQKIGELGNAATNIAFPLSTICLSIALMFGIGGASAFNISMGRGEREKAANYMGNAITVLVFCGLALMIVTEAFLRPMLLFFGSPEDCLGYAMQYTRVTALGFPLLLLSTGGGHLIRADGRPRMTMTCNLTGAVINTVLDALFVFVLDWGMAGAALATIIGQYVAGSMAIFCLSRCRTVRLSPANFKLHWCYVSKVMALGTASCANQLAMTVVQIVLNKSLKYYGALSSYGESIPIACAGIISKVNMVYMSFIIGLSQGMQPIASFNFGARNHARVKEAYIRAIRIGACLAIVAFCMFQFFPRQIISAFGSGSEAYFRFATNYFRIFLFFTFLNFLQPISSNLFTSIGQPKSGAFLSLTRQILFLLPMIVLLPLAFGIDGIMYAGPIADGLAALTCIVMVVREFGKEEYRRE